MKPIFWKCTYFSFALLGIILLIWGLEIYYDTVIDPQWLLIIGVSSSLIVYFIIRQHYQHIYETDNWFFAFGQATFSAGFIVISSFLMLNYYYSSGEIRYLTPEIIETGKLSGKNRRTYVDIFLEEGKKRLVLKGNPKINHSNVIELQIQKGLLGFDVIKKKEILYP